MHYQKNYLTNVILRLDFPQQNILLVQDKPTFSTDIKDRFPVVSSHQLSQMSFSMGPGQDAGFSKQTLGFKWDHRNAPDGNKVVVLSPSHLSIEYTQGQDAYDHFQEFQDNLMAVFEAFENRYQVPQFTRLGLRYVNEIVMPQGNPLNWDGLINNHLITSVKAGEKENFDLTRSIHQYSSAYDDISVNFIYGIKNPEYPSAVARREFILDFDCSISGEIESNDVLGRVVQLNEICSELFEDSIENDLRELMEVIEDA